MYTKLVYLYTSSKDEITILYKILMLISHLKQLNNNKLLQVVWIRLE